MNEETLLHAWSRARMQLIVAQLAPTFLLITTAGLIPALKSAGIWAVLATLGILLASGILGALVEFGAASDARAVAADLSNLSQLSHTADAAIRHARWLWVPQFLTPAIFVAIFVVLVVALLA